MNIGSKSIKKLVIYSVITTTLLVTPTFSYDPINVSRFFTLAIFGSISFFILLIYRKQLISKNRLLFFGLSMLFLLSSTVSLITSKLNFGDLIFGVTGRQTGYLTYVFLVLLMLLTSLVSNKNLASSLLKVLIVTGLISALYGLLQSLNLDPFEWINPYSPVFGLFGNPNFLSSFLGLSASGALAFLLTKNNKSSERIICMIYIPFTLYIIYKTKSQQGFLVLLIGIAIVLLLWLKNHSKYSKFLLHYMLLISILFVVTVLDILQRTPWNSILYKESVTLRGDFWRTGWNITKDNPIFGVGIEGYRDSYRLYRDQITTDRAPDSTVSSAHNVFLDLSSGGGVTLVFIYLLIVILVIVSAIKIIRRESSFNASFAGLFGAWVAYLAQSIISINQIGLAIWGWVLSGLIIGYEINTRTVSDKPIDLKSSQFSLAVILGVISGLVIAFPLLRADAQFRSTVKSGDVLKIEKNLSQWPQSVIRMNIAVQIFIDGGLSDRALVISKKAVELNPNNYESWEKIYLNPSVDEQDKSKAFAQMKLLDPLNPKLK
jgi:O-antigen ligase